VTIRFVETAEAELDAALRYYEGEPGLGAEFLTEVISVVNRIAEFPEAWQEGGVRHPQMPSKPLSLRHHLFA
jgi:hypothetical protein